MTTQRWLGKYPPELDLEQHPREETLQQLAKLSWCTKLSPSQLHLPPPRTTTLKANIHADTKLDCDKNKVLNHKSKNYTFIP